MQDLRKHTNLFKTGILIIGITVLVKIASLLKEIVFSSCYGTTILSDSYFTASIIPNLLNGPLVVSVLMFFIPTYIKAKQMSGQAAADKFVSNSLSVYSSISLALMLILVLFSETLSRLLAYHFPSIDVSLTAQLLRLSCLSFPVTMIAWIYTHLLNANNKFVVPQSLTLLNIGISIVGMFALHNKLGIIAVPLSSLVAWIIQSIIQGVYSRRLFTYHFVFDLRSQFIKNTFILAAPVFISYAADQLNLSVDNMIALTFVTGTVSVLNYSHKVFNLINGVLSTPMITVFYPAMATAYNDKSNAEFFELVKKLSSAILLLICPVTVICVMMSQEIIQIIYYRGAFTMSAVLQTADILQPYAIALPFVALKELYNRVFYIQQNSKTPLIITLVSIFINILLSIVLSSYFGIIGVAYATTIASVVAFAVEMIIVWRKSGYGFSHPNVKPLGQLFFSLVIMWIVMITIKSTSNEFPEFISMAIASTLSLLAYVGGLLLTKNDLALGCMKTIIAKLKGEKNEK